MAFSGALSAPWDVIGHDWAVRALEQAIASERIPHALLLIGPHGVGKTMLARALARRLQCTAENPPCGVCRACVRIAKGISPDVRVLEGVPPRWDLDKDGRMPPVRGNPREKRTLRIEQVREDVELWLATAPFESRYKIAIIRHFEEASEAASNAFLKTLEEPPAYAIIILTAEDEGSLLPTIVSRCQKLALRPLPQALIERALVERWQVEPGAAQLISRLAAGSPGWAVRAAGEPSLLEARARALDELTGLLKEGRSERLSRAGELAKEPEELVELLNLWLGWWRDVLLRQNGGAEGRVSNVDRWELLGAQGERYSGAQVQRAIESTHAALRQLDRNANARLVLEVLALDLPR